MREFAVNDHTLVTFNDTWDKIDVFINYIKRMQDRLVPDNIEFVLKSGIGDQDGECVLVEWRIATTFSNFDMAIEQFYLKQIKHKDNCNDLGKNIIVECYVESWMKEMVTVKNIENLINLTKNKNVTVSNDYQQIRQR